MAAFDSNRVWCGGRAVCLALVLAWLTTPARSGAAAPEAANAAAAAVERGLVLDAGEGRLGCSGSQVLRVRLEGDRDGIATLSLDLTYDPRVVALEHVVAPSGSLTLQRLPAEPALEPDADASIPAAGAGNRTTADARMSLRLEPRRPGSRYPETLVTFRLRGLVAGAGALRARALASGSAGAPSGLLEAALDLEVYCPGMTPVPPLAASDHDADLQRSDRADGGADEPRVNPGSEAAHDTGSRAGDWLPSAPASLPIAGSDPSPALEWTEREPCAHRLAFGESLSQLARSRGVTLSALLRANRGIPPRVMRPGTWLRIPSCAAPRPLRLAVPGARRG